MDSLVDKARNLKYNVFKLEHIHILNTITLKMRT